MAYVTVNSQIVTVNNDAVTLGTWYSSRVGKARRVREYAPFRYGLQNTRKGTPTTTTGDSHNGTHRCNRN